MLASLKTIPIFCRAEYLRTISQSFHKSTHIMAEDPKGKSSSASEQREDIIVAEEIEGASKPKVTKTTSDSKRTNACKPYKSRCTFRIKLTTQSQN